MQQLQYLIQNKLNKIYDLHIENSCIEDCPLCFVEDFVEIERGSIYYENLVLLEQDFNEHLKHRTLLNYPRETRLLCSFCQEEYIILKYNDKLFS